VIWRTILEEKASSANQRESCKRLQKRGRVYQGNQRGRAKSTGKKENGYDKKVKDVRSNTLSLRTRMFKRKGHCSSKNQLVSAGGEGNRVQTEEIKR